MHLLIGLALAAPLHPSAGPIRSLIAPGAPVLFEISLQNTTDQPLTIDTFDDPRCLMAHTLTFSVRPEAVARPMPPCNAVPLVLEAHESHRVVVDLRTHFGLVGSVHRFALGWLIDGFRNGTTLYDVQEREPLREVRLAMGEGVTLPLGTFRFDGHGHKHTYPGQRSPLLIRGTWTPKGGAEEPVSTSVLTDRQFVVGPYTFDVLEYSYDEWMALRVFLTP